MSIIKRGSEKLSGILMKSARDRHHKEMRAGLTNPTVTLLTNNCSGGIIYHDLGLRFLSPTIDLFFSDEDFIRFLSDLDYYGACPITETFEEGKNYPVGIAGEKEKSITINFMHYQSFHEAVGKWRDRYSRIDKNNIRVIFEIPQKVDQSLIDKFNALPYAHKMIITAPGNVKNANACFLDLYDDRFYPGKIFKYKGFFSTKRYLEDFDYVSFINGDD